MARKIPTQLHIVFEPRHSTDSGYPCNPTRIILRSPDAPVLTSFFHPDPALPEGSVCLHSDYVTCSSALDLDKVYVSSNVKSIAAIGAKLLREVVQLYEDSDDATIVQKAAEQELYSCPLGGIGKVEYDAQSTYLYWYISYHCKAHRSAADVLGSQGSRPGGPTPSAPSATTTGTAVTTVTGVPSKAEAKITDNEMLALLHKASSYSGDTRELQLMQIAACKAERKCHDSFRAILRDAARVLPRGCDGLYLLPSNSGPLSKTSIDFMKRMSSGRMLYMLLTTDRFPWEIYGPYEEALNTVPALDKGSCRNNKDDRFRLPQLSVMKVKGRKSKNMVGTIGEMLSKTNANLRREVRAAVLVMGQGVTTAPGKAEALVTGAVEAVLGMASTGTANAAPAVTEPPAAPVEVAEVLPTGENMEHIGAGVPATLPKSANAHFLASKEVSGIAMISADRRDRILKILVEKQHEYTAKKPFASAGAQLPQVTDDHRASVSHLTALVLLKLCYQQTADGIYGVDALSNNSKQGAQSMIKRIRKDLDCFLLEPLSLYVGLSFCGNYQEAALLIADYATERLPNVAVSAPLNPAARSSLKVDLVKAATSGADGAMVSGAAGYVGHGPAGDAGRLPNGDVGCSDAEDAGCSAAGNLGLVAAVEEDLVEATVQEQDFAKQDHMGVEDGGQAGQSQQAACSGHPEEHDNFKPLAGFDSLIKALGVKIPKPNIVRTAHWHGSGGSGSGDGGGGSSHGAGNVIKGRRKAAAHTPAPPKNLDHKQPSNRVEVLKHAAAVAELALLAAEKRYRNAQVIADALPQGIPAKAIHAMMQDLSEAKLQVTTAKRALIQARTAIKQCKLTATKLPPVAEEPNLEDETETGETIGSSSSSGRDNVDSSSSSSDNSAGVADKDGRVNSNVRSGKENTVGVQVCRRQTRSTRTALQPQQQQQQVPQKRGVEEEKKGGGMVKKRNTTRKENL